MSPLRQIANKWDPTSAVLETKPDATPPAQAALSSPPPVLPRRPTPAAASQPSMPQPAPQPPKPAAVPGSPQPSGSGGFAVRLLNAGNSKILAIKEVRQATSLGLKESKDLVDGAPAIVAQGLSLSEAQLLAQRFTSIGAIADVRATP
jgi:ribosomal protein L7/L12